ncbi:thiamine phosphate synthase [Cutibacterium sp. WCA-380-WT-3A]|uniref:Thiamine-phosphate synthase n=1 Tax=Cutibacterium porci TaxID=2605781 RepID=A0A7K0J733_9ACTN|nr:thiamine phosphate synthase [Cutibacterium porci]MSS45759.1 thiamine phosphate synthase [Cutibacterium porci]
MSRPDFDLSVYLVTDTDQCGGPDEVVETVRRAIAGGVTLVQLRDHDLSDDEFVVLGRRIKDVCIPAGVPLIVDDRVHLVAEIGADGAHIGQSDMPVDQARAMLGDDLLIGLSAQTPAQVEAALSQGRDVVDYLGVGALHGTGTKPEAGELGLAGIRDVVDVSPWPVCVIGGVTAADAQDLARLGCDGLSVVSAICRSTDPEASARELAQAWRNAKA